DDENGITEQPDGQPVTCTAQVGDVLLMRPLLWHASSSSSEPTHRRVVHLEFAPADVLHSQLTWKWKC
ncbi:MAG: phytanoyl-CoA dioxygenase, partial [Planctomycetota bacterium]